MSDPLVGRVVALIGTGSATDRAVAVACAEAGADLALATESLERSQEFGMNSIANELWAIGREHFVRLMEATPASIAEFVHEARRRLGRCDVLVSRVATGVLNGPPVVVPAATPEDTLAAIRTAVGAWPNG